MDKKYVIQISSNFHGKMGRLFQIDKDSYYNIVEVDNGSTLNELTEYYNHLSLKNITDLIHKFKISQRNDKIKTILND